MAICRYWQMGQCRLGNQCRFEHSAAQPFGGGFGGQQVQQQQGDITHTLVQTVKVDLEQWEKGRQWIFSCYSPAKETACFPGLDDLSPEELRLEAYTAAASSPSGLDQYRARVNSLMEEYAAKRRALLNPTEEIKEVLRRIYRKESVTGMTPLSNISATSTGGIFGGSTSSSSAFQPRSSASSLFGGGQQQSNVFSKPATLGSSTTQSSALFGGASTSTGSVFGGGQSTFGQSSPSSLVKPSAFGGVGQPQAAAFGSAPTFGQQSVFGGQQSIFGGQGASGNTTSSSQSVFGGSTTAFGSTGAPSFSKPGSSVFGGTTTSSPFSTNTTGGLFSSPTQQNPPVSSSLFGGSTSVFGSSPAASTSSFFGTATTTAATSSAFSNPFGQSTQPSTSNIFGASTTTAGSSNVFASPQTPSAAPLFAQQSASGPFGAQTSSTPFASQATTATNAVTSTPFGNPTSTVSGGIFGSQQGQSTPAAPNPFGAGQPTSTAQQQSPFGTQSVSTSSELFTKPDTAVASSGDLFGKSSNPGGNFFGQAVAERIDPSTYTPHDQLTEEELAAFMAEEFVLGKVPERPPSKELVQMMKAK